MRIRSCFVRYARYMFVSAICSVLTFFMYSKASLNNFRLNVISFILFVIINAVDSYIFESYFGKRKHFKFGIAYPYTMFIFTSYILYFIIKGSRWNYLFLPFEVFTGYGISRLVSLTSVHLIVIFIIAVFSAFGNKKFYKDN